MSIVGQQAAPAGARPRSFAVHFVIDGHVYAVGALAAHPEIARKAFALRKLTAGEETVYHVRLAGHGLECDCRGFVRWGHCKHSSVLEAAARTFALPEVPVAQEGGHA